MKILITGGAGFIGTNSALFFKEKGYNEIHIFDNLSKKGSEKNLKMLNFVKFHHGDLSKLEDIDKCLSSYLFDAILHLGGQTAVTTSTTDPRTDFNSNALGTFNLLESIRKFCPLAKLIYSSTNKVYGSLKNQKIRETDLRYELTDSPDGIKDTELLEFYSPYGCSKGCADQYVNDYSRIYNLNTFVLRQSCIYGCHQNGTEDQGWLSWFIQAYLENHPLTIYGDGKQVRDLLHVQDLANLYVKMFESKTVESNIYNVGGGPQNTISLLETVKFLDQAIETKTILFGKERPGDQKVFYSDNYKIKQDFNWEPKINKEKGIFEIINFYKNV